MYRHLSVVCVLSISCLLVSAEPKPLNTLSIKLDPSARPQALISREQEIELALKGDNIGRGQQRRVQLPPHLPVVGGQPGPGHHFSK